jgi:flagellar biosynthesis/type III secretory pathway M-ring protein FliF/YscJ
VRRRRRWQRQQACHPPLASSPPSELKKNLRRMRLIRARNVLLLFLALLLFVAVMRLVARLRGQKAEADAGMQRSQRPPERREVTL